MAISKVGGRVAHDLRHMADPPYAPSTPPLEREDVFGEILDLLWGELARLAVRVVGVGDGQYLLHREGTAVVEIRGGCYRNGDGVEKNPVEGVKWYSKAAEQGFADAQYELGRLYFLGDAVPHNKTEAIELLKMASDQGHVEARRALTAAGMSKG